jgi:hypothetical protein
MFALKVPVTNIIPTVESIHQLVGQYPDGISAVELLNILVDSGYAGSDSHRVIQQALEQKMLYSGHNLKIHACSEVEMQRRYKQQRLNAINQKISDVIKEALAANLSVVEIMANVQGVCENRP